MNLYVVDNNQQDSIGGGGVPRMPLAPDFITTSINEQSIIQSLKIFPNPTTGKFIIEYENDQNLPLTITLKSITGNLVFSENINSSNCNIDISSYPSGVYLLELNSKTASHRCKIAKLQN